VTVTFDEEFVAMACGQVNAHHADDALAICRNLGGAPDAERAEVTGIDGDGLDIAATVDSEVVPVRVAFLQPVTDSSRARVAVVDLARHARGPRNTL
jgi:putative heme iron utilization protein